ncbi:hypothetical protein BC832DRAFT_309982 [Gaertneriomyces semiglobifer]|nr:hypothetical protein BC832DRAFT_309982 [Gaertneriomyces semiglobifer]
MIVLLPVPVLPAAFHLTNFALMTAMSSCRYPPYETEPSPSGVRDATKDNLGDEAPCSLQHSASGLGIGCLSRYGKRCRLSLTVAKGMAAPARSEPYVAPCAAVRINEDAW